MATIWEIIGCDCFLTLERVLFTIDCIKQKGRVPVET